MTQRRAAKLVKHETRICYERLGTACFRILSIYVPIILTRRVVVFVDSRMARCPPYPKQKCFAVTHMRAPSRAGVRRVILNYAERRTRQHTFR